ncbi:hypothetical protein THAOC_03976 [Thalassiosira oceanica]|uniref:Uncharacterized protein n=1 Tax=Thalassiosira oceanica TaxID=159749 RepID=K0TPC1_THAOC|nr:hypothetical protein THAOC_03976 [Thalassiosira oceanica]|eukprot:EJK74347.1 hypothetical protein THAOC_03976 [Thalassiosira oceanica]
MARYAIPPHRTGDADARRSHRIPPHTVDGGRASKSRPQPHPHRIARRQARATSRATSRTRATALQHSNTPADSERPHQQVTLQHAPLLIGRWSLTCVVLAPGTTAPAPSGGKCRSATSRFVIRNLILVHFLRWLSITRGTVRSSRPNQ